MYYKIMRGCFVALFVLLITLPFLTVNTERSSISENEKRVLAQSAPLIVDGRFNTEFPESFEVWLNDNIGFRSQMLRLNAEIQYKIFHELPNNYYNNTLGPNGETNYLTPDIVKSYQHENLLSERDLEVIAESYQRLGDYVRQNGAAFYYVQCWDRQSVYPEYFPNSILQHGDVSRSDQIVSAIKNRTDINIISLKHVLLEAKKQYNVYGTWYDASHWTERGAYIGYIEIMNTINQEHGGKYLILNEDDYIITVQDMGETQFGGIHKPDDQEVFEIRNPKAYQTDEIPIIHSTYGDVKLYYNDSVDNEDTLLILGDSYIAAYLYDDFAESFHRVVYVRSALVRQIEKLMQYYQPAVVINENVERQGGEEHVIWVADTL